MKRAFGERAVAEKHAGDTAGFAQLMSKSAANRNGKTSADDAVRSEHPDRHVGDMHGAAAAATIPFAPPQDFEKEPRHIEPLGEGVPVATMIGCKRIVPLERRGDPDRNRFLSDREMDEARNFPVTK